MKVSKEKILILGGTGYIGRNLVSKLSKKFSVTSVSLKKEKKNFKIKNIKYLFLNLLKLNNLKKIKQNYSFVINCLNLSTNKKIFDFYLDKGLKNFIHIGSASEYGNGRVPNKESNKSRPISTYGKKKLKDTKYLIELFKEKKFPSVIVRVFNPYGNFQTNGVIPYVIYNCKKNKKFILKSSYQTRDFCHINDICEAVHRILKIDKKEKISGKIFNISSGKDISIKKLVFLIQNKIKKGHPQFNRTRNKKIQIEKSKADISRAKNYLKWRPKINLNYGLQKTINEK